MYRVTRLNPVSWAKAFTLAWLIIAIVVAILFMVPMAVMSGIGAAASAESRAPLLLVIPIGLVIGTAGLLAVAVMVFVISLIQATAFNWALGRTGGIELDLGLGPSYTAPVPAPASPVVAPVAAAPMLDAPATDQTSAMLVPPTAETAPPAPDALSASDEAAPMDEHPLGTS